MPFQVIYPLDVANPQVRITQYYGANPGNYLWAFPNGAGHEGIDWGCPNGTLIWAGADGIVQVIGLDKNQAYGFHVRIDHQYEGQVYQTIYAHLAAIDVHVGQRVVAGQIVGKSNNTGNSTGPHLHFSLKKRGATAAGETKHTGDYVNPLPYLVHGRPIELPKGKPVIVQVDAVNIRKLANVLSEKITTVFKNQTLRLDENQAIISDNEYRWGQLAEDQVINGKDIAGCWVVIAKIEITPWVK